MGQRGWYSFSVLRELGGHRHHLQRLHLSCAPLCIPQTLQPTTSASLPRRAQRIVAELLQRLGVHVLSGRPVKVTYAKHK